MGLIILLILVLALALVIYFFGVDPKGMSVVEAEKMVSEFHKVLIDNDLIDKLCINSNTTVYGILGVSFMSKPDRFQFRVDIERNGLKSYLEFDNPKRMLSILRTDRDRYIKLQNQLKHFQKEICNLS